MYINELMSIESMMAGPRSQSSCEPVILACMHACMDSSVDPQLMEAFGGKQKGMSAAGREKIMHPCISNMGVGEGTCTDTIAPSFCGQPVEQVAVKYMT